MKFEGVEGGGTVAQEVCKPVTEEILDVIKGKFYCRLILFLYFYPFVPLTSDRLLFSMAIQLFLFSVTTQVHFFYRLIQSSWGNDPLCFNKGKCCILSWIVSRINKVDYKKVKAFLIII